MEVQRRNFSSDVRRTIPTGRYITTSSTPVPLWPSWIMRPSKLFVSILRSHFTLQYWRDDAIECTTIQFSWAQTPSTGVEALFLPIAKRVGPLLTP